MSLNTESTPSDTLGSAALTPNLDTRQLTTSIVTAFLASNPTAAADLPGLIERIYSTLNGLGADSSKAESGPLVPAVPVKQSIKHDYIVCLEDGKRLKSMRRHLNTKYNLTPAEYREKWGLPHDYPMVCPDYAVRRSAMARNSGLGNWRAKRAEEAARAA